MFDTEIKSLKSLNHYLLKLVESRLWLKVIIALFLGVGLVTQINRSTQDLARLFQLGIDFGAQGGSVDS